MEGYHSSVNRTMTEESYYVYYVNNNNEARLLGEESEEYKNVFKDEGYYWNKADLENDGVILQIMKIPKRDATGGLVEDKVNKFKFITNKCNSSTPEVCSYAKSESIVTKGSACVVMDGTYKGLHYALNNISYTSKTTNCLRAQDHTLYEYIGSDAIEFSGEYVRDTIVAINENDINLFKHDISDPNNKENYDEGYYVLDKNHQLLNSTMQVSTTAYYCGIGNDKNNNNNDNISETTKYQCQLISKPNGYYHANSQILYTTGTKWYSETKYGYYFYNENHLAATNYWNGNENVYDTNIKSVDPLPPGTYINSMVTDIVILVNYDGEAYSIEPNIQYCKVKANKSCQSTSVEQPLTHGSHCYDDVSKKLYFVEVTKSEENNKGDLEDIDAEISCYSGSENDIQYFYDNGKLYQMDGLSIQSMKNGYYILNDQWKAFNSNYPEVPYRIIKCEDYICEQILTEFSINSDIVINEAGLFNNKSLKYYKEGNVVKFINADQPGYYFLTNKSEVSYDSDLTEIYEITQQGELIQLDREMMKLISKDNIIYINYANQLHHFTI